MSYLYVGVDVGKQHHHIAVVDDHGTLISSERVPNDQAHLQAVIKQICHRRRNIRWAVDINTGPSSLLIALLHARGLDVRYINGHLFAHIAPAFSGERKTDAADALVIAHTLRTRHDLPAITPGDPAQAQLHVLTEHRRDLVEQRVCTIMRMQAVLTTISPALAGVLDLTLRGPVHILAHWQTPAAIRRAAPEQIHALLRQYKVNNGRQLTAAVITSARGQTIRTAGEATNAAVLGQLALDLQDVNARIDAADAQIAEALTGHPLAEIVLSMPGMGPILSAEFLAHAGKPDTHPTASRLAAHAGFAPVNRDSGSTSGNLRRPHRFHRTLRRVFLMSALSAIRSHPESAAYYQRKRAEGKTHRQALGALGRRRINIPLDHDPKPAALPHAPRTGVTPRERAVVTTRGNTPETRLLIERPLDRNRKIAQARTCAQQCLQAAKTYGTCASDGRHGFLDASGPANASGSVTRDNLDGLPAVDDEGMSDGEGGGR